ncbi:MAG: TonB-dependent receptor [Candidatus Eisenbacteria bacterium]|nr:TonB-dependent receptor [Candidatus Eisenbacteria bacterium]
MNREETGKGRGELQSYPGSILAIGDDETHQKLRRLQRLSLIALLIALSVAGGYAVPFPNVELITFFVFVSGYILGISGGLAVGISSELIYSLLNPMGAPFPLVLISQIAGMGVAGACGGLARKVIAKTHFPENPGSVGSARALDSGERSFRKARTGVLCILLFLLGFLVTISFDLITNIALALTIGDGSLAKVGVVLVGGAYFALLHSVSNAIIFGVAGAAALRFLGSKLQTIAPGCLVLVAVGLLSSTGLASGGDDADTARVKSDIASLPKEMLAARTGMTGEIATIVPEIVVTATRLGLSPFRLPVSVVLLSHDDIERKPGVSCGDIVNEAPGAALGDYGGKGQLQVLSLRGSSSEQVQVLIDGIPVKSPQNGGFDFNLVSPKEIESIEIVKGVGSSLYGADGVGGLVNLVTRRRNEAGPYSSVRLQNGMFGGKRYMAEVSRSLYTTLTVHLLFDLEQSSGARENSIFDSNRYFGKVRWDATNSLSLQYVGKLVSSECGTPGPEPDPSELTGSLGYDIYTNYYRAVNLGLGDSRVSSLANRVDGRFFLSTLSLDAAGPAETRNSFKLFRLTEQSLFKSVFINVDYDTLFNPYPLFYDGEEDSKTETRGFRVESSRKGKSYGISAGLEGRQDELRFSRKALPRGAGASGLTTLHPAVSSFGVFSEAHISPLRRASVSTGVRLDRHSTYGVEVNPWLGLSFFVRENVAMQASLARGFRAPTFNDLYWPEDSWTKGNPHIKPERSVSGSLVGKYSGGFTGIEASLFRTDATNLIEWAPDPLDTFYQKWMPTNVGKSLTRGGEVELSVGRGESRIASFTYTYLEAKDKRSNLPLLYRPKHKAGGDIHLGFWLFSRSLRVSPGIAGEFVGTRFREGGAGKTMPWYSLLHANLRLQITDVTFYGSLRNLTDATYETRKGYPMPGRNYVFGFSWEFLD